MMWGEFLMVMFGLSGLCWIVRFTSRLSQSHSGEWKRSMTEKGAIRAGNVDLLCIEVSP